MAPAAPRQLRPGQRSRRVVVGGRVLLQTVEDAVVEEVELTAPTRAREVILAAMEAYFEALHSGQFRGEPFDPRQKAADAILDGLIREGLVPTA